MAVIVATHGPRVVEVSDPVEMIATHTPMVAGKSTIPQGDPVTGFKLEELGGQLLMKLAVRETLER